MTNNVEKFIEYDLTGERKNDTPRYEDLTEEEKLLVNNFPHPDIRLFNDNTESKDWYGPFAVTFLVLFPTILFKIKTYPNASFSYDFIINEILPITVTATLLFFIIPIIWTRKYAKTFATNYYRTKDPSFLEIGKMVLLLFYIPFAFMLALIMVAFF